MIGLAVLLAVRWTAGLPPEITPALRCNLVLRNFSFSDFETSRLQI